MRRTYSLNIALSFLLLLTLSPRDRFTAGALTASTLRVRGHTLGFTVLGGGGRGRKGNAWWGRRLIEDDRFGGESSREEWFIEGGGALWGDVDVMTEQRVQQDDTVGLVVGYSPELVALRLLQQYD
jgi:hypothetical protein